MPETDFPCCEAKPATKPPEWYRDRVRQAINRYQVNADLEADHRRLAKMHHGQTADLLKQAADDWRRLAHDAVLEAAEAVRQERTS